MKVTFDLDAWAEYLDWQLSDAKVLLRLNSLIEECRRDPFRGTGTEPLGRDLRGWWSRRITQEHRLAYRVSRSGDAQTLEIAQCRYQYGTGNRAQRKTTAATAT